MAKQGRKGAKIASKPARSENTWTGFAFLLNLGKLEGARSFTLAPGHRVRRATEREIAKIREALTRFGSDPMQSIWSVFEREVMRSGKIRALPRKRWRYYVVEFKMAGKVQATLMDSMILAPTELGIGFRIAYFKGTESLTWDGAQLVHELHRARFGQNFFQTLNKQAVRQIRDIYSKLSAHDHEIINLTSTINQLRDLKSMRHDSPLRYLGYFAIIESILTHAPKSTDPYDSITRQVYTKMALLNRRFAVSLPYKAHFGGVSPKKVWQSLYAYRSAIAHGSSPDFNSTQRKIIGNKDAALDFVRVATLSLVRQVLYEPAFIKDLRDC